MHNKPLILTLIAPSDQQILSSDLLHSLTEKIKLNGKIKLNEKINWLAVGEAVDISLNAACDNAQEPKSLAELRAEIHQIVSDRPIDFALQSPTNRRKKLLISDMDSTIIGQECIDEIAFMAGIKKQVATITDQAMHGKIDFEEALIARVNLLKGLSTEALNKVIDERLHLNKGARTLIRTMAKNDAFCALVSGGFTFFTEKIAEKAGFHTALANTLEIKQNQLTGRVIPPILGSAAKKHALENFASLNKITLDETLAVGDGANDLEMIKSAGLGVAYHAKPIVASGADAAINHTDLTAILYMQGYTKTQFVS